MLEILYLSPFLNTGFTTENFSLFGKIPEAWYLLHVYVKGELIQGALYFKILTDISSYLSEFFVIKDLIIFSISCIIRFHVWERVFKNLKHII
jgi:hypothetical protein